MCFCLLLIDILVVGIWLTIKKKILIGQEKKKTHSIWNEFSLLSYAVPNHTLLISEVQAKLLEVINYTFIFINRELLLSKL